MYHSDLAEQIEGVVENALTTNNFSELNKNIGDAVKTSIAQIGTNQNRFYQNYEDTETTMEQLEHVDGEIVNGDKRADYAARRRQAMAEAERARQNSRQAMEERRRQEARRKQEEAKRRAEESRSYDRSHTYSYRGMDNAAREERRQANRARNAQNQTSQHQTTSTPRRSRSQTDIVPISRKPAGRISGTLLTVFGSIGLGINLMLFLIFGLGATVGYAYGGLSYGTYIVLLTHFLLPFTSVSCLMLGSGLAKKNRIKRFYQYVRQLRGRAYCSIKELSSHIGRSDRYVLKDLKKMIQLGMFPEGHIDDQRTCVMLNGATYDQYLKAQNSYLERRSDAKDTANITARTESEEQKDTAATQPQTDNSSEHGRRNLPPKVLKVLTSGENYLTQIREANAAIPGVVISEKLDHLEQIIAKITARIEDHPEQVDDLDKFINYYLPTTLKLVNAYREFDAQPVQGENILSAKKEIEATLDTILYAFETLLDSLYEDDALDISTDISVLQTMFAQEGLTKSAFASEKSGASQ